MADEQIVQNQGTQEQPAPEQGMPAEFGTPSMDNDAIQDILGGTDRTMAEPSIYPETEAVTDSPKPVERTEEANPEVPTQADNEQVRYAYWQSQADKSKNEYNAWKYSLPANCGLGLASKSISGCWSNLMSLS